MLVTQITDSQLSKQLNEATGLKDNPKQATLTAGPLAGQGLVSGY